MCISKLFREKKRNKETYAEILMFKIKKNQNQFETDWRSLLIIKWSMLIDWWKDRLNRLK